jgi:hypothetical protein
VNRERLEERVWPFEYRQHITRRSSGIEIAMGRRMKKQLARTDTNFLFSAAIVLFFATLSALALYAAGTIDQADLLF